MNETNRTRAISLPENMPDTYNEILSNDAVQFVAELHRRFNPPRLQLLQARRKRQEDIDAGILPDFLPETARVREDRNWRVAPIPDPLQQRWVEITGPIDRKMMINALNSGSNVFMADCEDANSPTWANIVEGQINLRDAVRGTISFVNPNGKRYDLAPDPALLLVRPRGWHLPEKHLRIDGAPASASLVDFGLYFFHNAKTLIDKGLGPYFYLPKLESHLEARLWNDVFVAAQDMLGIPKATIKATVLIENVLAAFEMEEILYELREHMAGLNAGRWDYIFSVIKKFARKPGFVLPDRSQIGMAVPFMRAYTELLVKTCHRRGAHAIGGMAAFIPSRRDEEVNRVALTRVREDKVREFNDGFDGTWIAHPDLVPVARGEWERIVGEKLHQKDRLREDVRISADDLLNFTIEGGEITEQGLRLNINVGIQYIESWLRGVGAAALYNLMEDAATAEISRAQVWQWIHSPHGAFSDGTDITVELVNELIDEELAAIRKMYGDDLFESGRFPEAASLFVQLVTSDEFADFLTLPAYDLLD